MYEFQSDCGLRLIKDLVKEDEAISRIYGFILYTEEDPFVKAVLRNNDYWDALNSISGSNWPIFAVRPLAKGHFDIKGSTLPGTFSYLVPTWNEPKENRLIIRDFGLEDSKDLPVFVAFIWDDNDELNEVLVPIDSNDEISTYSSLKEIIRIISETEKSILPEYKKSITVFNNVKSELEALKFKHKVIKRGKIIAKIAQFLSSFIS